MKDAVKITVIATGFKDADVVRRRQEATRTPLISQRPKRDAFFDDPEIEPTPEPVPDMVMQAPAEAVQVVEPTPVQPQVAVAPSFQPDDLDVPAFMRKRTEIM
jgi:hypothetical protein